MSVDFVQSPEPHPILPSNCLFLNDLSVKIYLGKINHTLPKNLDFTMLSRIKTKTNLIAPCFKNALMRLLFDNAYISGWLFILKEHFVKSKCMLFYMCLT